MPLPNSAWLSPGFGDVALFGRSAVAIHADGRRCEPGIFVASSMARRMVSCSGGGMLAIGVAENSA